MVLSTDGSGVETQWKVVNLKVDTAVKALSLVGLAIAAVVAYFNITAQQEQRRMTRDQIAEAEKNRISLDLRITSQPITTDDDSALLILDFFLENTGLDTISPYSHKHDESPDGPQYDGEGCTFSLTEHILPENEGLISWDGRRVVKRINILEKYDYDRPGSWCDRYRIRPKTTYHETEAVAVQRGRLYEATIRFYGKGMGTITENRYYYVP
jgi:hypothetical protein